MNNKTRKELLHLSGGINRFLHKLRVESCINTPDFPHRSLFSYQQATLIDLGPRYNHINSITDEIHKAYRDYVW
jgi:hypothetical protein